MIMHEHIKARDHYANHNASCGVNQYRQAKRENTLDNETLFLCTIDISMQITSISIASI
jgi:hypothetical protein